MSDLTKDVPKGTLTKEETIVYLIEVDNRFLIEPSVMRNAIYSACHYLDEESAKEPQECEWIYDGDGYYLHGNDWISGKSDFKFCPYCGKVIKDNCSQKGRDDRWKQD